MTRYTIPPESAQGLWYSPQINRFINEGGYILHDLSAYFPLWILDEWKQTKEYALMQDRNGDWWELYYMIPDPDEGDCTHKCDSCGSRCEIYNFLKDWEKEKDFIKVRKELCLSEFES